MNRLKLVVVIVSLVIVLETLTIGFLLVQPNNPVSRTLEYQPVHLQTFSMPFFLFNTPISNDTEYNLTQTYTGSWMIVIQSQLTSTNHNASTEAQIAIAPEYPSENLSIPTIIVQERADGLLRIEYYAQDWPKTYGLVLYNSTSPTWLNMQNVTLTFISYGPPSPVNPQLAPRPNGNLTITVGQMVVLSDYPIAWANLSGLYVYGLSSSSFTDGIVYVDVFRLQPRTS